MSSDSDREPKVVVEPIECEEEKTYCECEDCGTADASVGLCPAPCVDKTIEINLCERCDESMTLRLEEEGYKWDYCRGRWCPEEDEEED